MEALVAIKCEEENLEQMREWATKDLLNNFFLSLFTFCQESDRSFVGTSLANVEIVFGEPKVLKNVVFD